MTLPAPSAETLVSLIRTNIGELAHVTSAGSTFDELELDSLSMVEIATIVGQTYGVPIDEAEVVEAGDFERLTALVHQRLAD